MISTPPITVTHSVKGSGTAAPRWYELRNTAGTGWAITQQSSYAPDATYRWMGSAAQDKAELRDFFETKVRPVLAENCFSCHGPKKQQSDFRLDDLGIRVVMEWPG